MMLDGHYFQAVDEEGNPVKPERVAKPASTRVLMSLRPDGRAISFFGDLHPSFAGNVVKAMGSAKQGYPVVSRVLAKLPQPASAPKQLLVDELNDELRAIVSRRHPAHAEHRRSRREGADGGTRIPARPVLPASELRNPRARDRDNGARDGGPRAHRRIGRSRTGLLSTIVLEMGGSSDLCALLKPGEPVILMGPDRYADRNAATGNRAARRRRTR